MNRFIAICWEKGESQRAFAATQTLREAGIAVECFYSGKADKQFNRAKRMGALEIAVVGEEFTRFWRANDPGTNCTLKEFVDYQLWLADDLDILPDPPWYMLPIRVKEKKGEQTDA